jgi:uncharacterized protein YndB with AHSA1/START domain
VIRIDFSVEIDRTPSEVFAYLTDLDNLPEWQASAMQARWEGEKAAGARIKEVRKFLGRRMESELEVLEYEPDRRLVLKTLTGPVQLVAEHTVEPTNGGTRLVFHGEGEPGGFFRLAEGVVARNAERSVRNDFETLKDVLEARSS